MMKIFKSIDRTDDSIRINQKQKILDLFNEFNNLKNTIIVDLKDELETKTINDTKLGTLGIFQILNDILYLNKQTNNKIYDKEFVCEEITYFDDLYSEFIENKIFEDVKNINLNPVRITNRECLEIFNKDYKTCLNNFYDNDLSILSIF